MMLSNLEIDRLKDRCVPFLTNSGKEVRILKILNGNYQSENDLLNMRILRYLFWNEPTKEELINQFSLDYCEIE